LDWAEPGFVRSIPVCHKHFGGGRVGFGWKRRRWIKIWIKRGIADRAGSGFAAEGAFHDREEEFALGVGVGSGLWLGFSEGFG